jgi:hypothetical protein
MHNDELHIFYSAPNTESARVMYSVQWLDFGLDDGGFES